MLEPDRLTAHIHNMLLLAKGESDSVGALLIRARETLLKRPWLQLTNQPLVNRSVLIRVMEHGATVWGLAWSPRGRLLASAGSDGVVRIWETAIGTLVALLEPSAGQANAISWSPDGTTLASGHDDGTVRLWDTDGFQQHTVLNNQGGAIVAMAWSPNGRYIAAGGEGNMIHLWDLSTKKKRAFIVKESEFIFYTVTWSPDGSLLAAGGKDGIVRIWECATGREHAILEDHRLKELLGETGRDLSNKYIQLECSVFALTWSPDGNTLASGTRLGTLRLWNPIKGTPEDFLIVAGAGIPSLAWSPDQSLLAWGSGEGSIYAGNPEQKQQLRLPEGHNFAVRALAWSPDGFLLASGSDDNTIRLWDVKTFWDQAPDIVKPIEGHGAGVPVVTWSGDGSFLASGGKDQYVYLWDPITGALHAKSEMLNGPVFSLAPYKEGVLFASNSFGGETTVTFWKRPQEAPMSLMKLDETSVFSLAVSPDGEYIALGDVVGTVWVHEIASGELVAVFLRSESDTQANPKPSPVWALNWSPGGTLLISVGTGEIVLWDIITGRKRNVLELARTSFQQDTQGHEGEALYIQCEEHAAVWSPDGHFIASDSSNNTIRLWDSVMGNEVMALKGHNGQVTSLAWSPIGGLLASGSSDRTIRLWEVETGSCLVISPCLSTIRALKFSNDGRLLHAVDDGSATGNRPIPYIFELCNI
jgi:WD40 repeat protein